MNAEDVILEVSHLEKSFGSHDVLRDISFQVAKGDVVSVMDIEEEKLIVVGGKLGFRINSATPISNVEVYSPEGLKVKELRLSDCSAFVSVAPGFYIVRITRGNGGAVVKKILVTE